MLNLADGRGQVCCGEIADRWPDPWPEWDVRPESQLSVAEAAIANTALAPSGSGYRHRPELPLSLHGVAVGVAVGVDVRVTVGVAVAVAVGVAMLVGVPVCVGVTVVAVAMVAVGVTVAVAGAVEVVVAVGVSVLSGVAVGVGVVLGGGVASLSKAPISHWTPTGRVTPR